MDNDMTEFFTDKHLDSDSPVVSDGKPQPVHGEVHSVSFSTLQDYERCPYKVFLYKGRGMARLGNEYTERGSHCHEILEHYVMGELDEVEWDTFRSGDYHQKLIETFREGYANNQCITELKYAFDEDMNVIEWDQAWLRGAIDVVVIQDDKAIIYDYKTGSNKSTAKHRDQLMLYALLMFMLYPELEQIQSAPLYLDHKQEPFYNNYTRNDLELLWPRYYDRLKRVTDTTEWVANPNRFNCNWCSYSEPQPTVGQEEAACPYHW